jgi:hypothetical protein
MRTTEKGHEELRKQRLHDTVRVGDNVSFKPAYEPRIFGKVRAVHGKSYVVYIPEMDLCMIHPGAGLTKECG